MKVVKHKLIELNEDNIEHSGDVVKWAKRWI